MNDSIHTFDGISEFVTTVRTGSFTAAGEHLSLTGSAVGKSVTRLEKRLQTKLLHRTTRRLTLTPEGQRYFEGWVSLLDGIQGLEDDMTSGTGRISGRLHIHLPAAFGRRHVMPLLMALTREHPALDLSVHFTERRVNLIEEGIDLAVRIGTLADDAELVARPLGHQRLVICASPDYIAKHGKPASADELNKHDCLVGSRHNQPSTWLLKDTAGTTRTQPVRVRHEFSDGDALLAATLAGAGLAQLPTWLVHEHLASGALIPILEDYTGAEMPIQVIWPRTRYVKAGQRTVIDALTREAEQTRSIYRV